jgi:hypothetical protein
MWSQRKGSKTLLFIFFKYRIEFINSMGRGVKRVVAAKKGRERERERESAVEASHEYMDREVGREWGEKGKAKQGNKRKSREIRKEQETKRA